MKKAFILLFLLCSLFTMAQDTIPESELPTIEFKVTKKTNKFNISQVTTASDGIVTTLQFPTLDSTQAKALVTNFTNMQDSIILYNKRELDQRDQYIKNLETEYLRVKNEQRAFKKEIRISERRKQKLINLKL